MTKFQTTSIFVLWIYQIYDIPVVEGNFNNAVSEIPNSIDENIEEHNASQEN